VHNLTQSPNYPNSPSSSSQLTIFEGPTNFADAYGSRIRGYVCAPETGNYTFWIASDDNSELWLSTSDNPANKVLIASVNGWTGVRQWTQLASQQSVPVALTAGRRYYIEALHKDGGGGDHVSVGWQLPSGTLERPIPGTRLSPWVNGRPAGIRRPPRGNPGRTAAAVPGAGPRPGNGVLPGRGGRRSGRAGVRRPGAAQVLVKTQAVRGENNWNSPPGTLDDGLYSSR
jgi:hypothetical protein